MQPQNMCLSSAIRAYYCIECIIFLAENLHSDICPIDRSEYDIKMSPDVNRTNQNIAHGLATYMIDSNGIRTTAVVCPYYTIRSG